MIVPFSFKLVIFEMMIVVALAIFAECVPGRKWSVVVDVNDSLEFSK